MRYNKHMAERCWETDLVPDVNQFALDDFPMKGKGVKHMRFTLADTTYGCHVSEFPPDCRSTFIAIGPGAVIIIYAKAKGYVVLWGKTAQERQLHQFKVGTVYSPDDLSDTNAALIPAAVPCATLPCAATASVTSTSHDRLRNPLCGR